MRWAIYFFFAIAGSFAGTAVNADSTFQPTAPTLPTVTPVPITAPANEGTGEDPLVRLQFDSMEFSAKALRFMNDPSHDGKNKAGKLLRMFMLEGQSKFSLADDDFVITADKMSVATDGSEPISITAVGGCEYVEGDYDGTRVAADRIKFGKSGISFEGNVFFEGEQGTTIRADSVIVIEPRGRHPRLQINGAAEVTLPKQ